MLRKPQILSILFVFLVFALLTIFTNCQYDVGQLMEKMKAQSLWETSGHADTTAEAFIHWNEEVPPEVPDRCAKCHSTIGFLDFLGADGTTAGQVDNAAPIGTTVECDACHSNPDNGILRNHTSVTFPSGATIDNLGPEALCLECHQGREAKPSVDQEITDSGAPDDDTIESDMGFPNIHYYAAAATQFGTFVQGGYEYEGNAYDAHFSHVKGYNACFTCHDSHSLEIKLYLCSTCHDVTDPKDIRYYGSFVDYDGDGDMTEGIYYEIPDFQEKLYEAIQAYARQIGNPIIYDSHSHPYWFYDTNDNGEVDPGEDVDYESFTGRLLKACYNYQFSIKDPGGYAHGGKYIIQLLYDSIENLNEALTSPISLEGMERNDEGHFDGSAEAWRHWDEDGEVEEDCTKCHSAEGLAYFLENGTLTAQELSNGMLCTTCHTSPPGLRTVSSVTFPSGISKSLGDSSNICMSCHQGRKSKSIVDADIIADPGDIPGLYNFPDFNVHYYAVGAVLYGTEVQGGYEFDGKVYTGRKTFDNHNGRFDTCIECHMGTNTLRETFEPSDHNVHKPNQEDCVYCHGQDVSQPNPGIDPSKFKFSGIRPASIPDYDGDGNITESIKDEIAGLEEVLYAWIQFYATNTLAAPVIYSNSYPYFFNDTNGNGQVDPGEDIYPNQYGEKMDATLLKAAYNYQFSKKEPHGFIHNSRYIAQLLVDSIESLGGNISIYTWR